MDGSGGCGAEMPARVECELCAIEMCVVRVCRLESWPSKLFNQFPVGAWWVHTEG